MALPWWLDPITQAFNPPVEPGEDIGTPFHTPITALAPGRVSSVSRGGFGERVDITLASGGGIVEYYQHLDQIAPGLNVGSQVTAGQLLGLSGGQLSGGANPNSPLNSTGPHIEFGIIGPRGIALNPAQTVAAGPDAPPGIGSAGPPPGAPGSNAQAGGGGLVNINFPDPIGSLRDWINSGAGQLRGQVTGQTGGFWATYAIPLVIAGLIILVVLGTGQKQAPAPPQAQIIPVPV